MKFRKILPGACRALVFLAGAQLVGCSAAQEEAQSSSAPIVVVSAPDADIDMRLSQDALSEFIQAVRLSGEAGDWVWNVTGTSVTIGAAAGIRVRGTVVASRTVQTQIDGKTIGVPQMQRLTFDQPVSMGYDAGGHQFWFAVQRPTTLSLPAQDGTSVSFQPGAGLTTQMPLVAQQVSFSGLRLTLGPGPAQVSVHDGYVQALSQLDVH